MDDRVIKSSGRRPDGNKRQAEQKPEYAEENDIRQDIQAFPSGKRSAASAPPRIYNHVREDTFSWRLL